MEIKKGTTRIAFVFDYFVVKIPVIDFMEIFRTFYYTQVLFFKSIKKDGLKEYYLKRLIKKRKDAKENAEDILRRSEKLGLEILPLKFYEIRGVKYLLFFGIMANLNEFIFYRKTKNIFVMPTYFSFFGLINIQKRGKEIDFWNYLDIWRYICHNSANEDQPFCSPHSFSKKENFCLDGDKLKMLDYGSRHVNNFLILNGERLFNNFVKPPV